MVFFTKANAPIIFGTGGNSISANQRMVITGTGNVGIGTTSPITTLSVNGNGFLTGNFTAANITATVP